MLPEGPSRPDLMPAKTVYALYAIGYLVALTTVAGVIYAHLTRGRDPLLDSHFDFQIRTFWISLAIAALALATMVLGIGFLIWIFLAIWGLLRTVSGFLLAHEGKPITGTRHLGMIAY